jgi:hypothetical protein
MKSKIEVSSDSQFSLEVDECKTVQPASKPPTPPPLKLIPIPPTAEVINTTPQPLSSQQSSQCFRLNGLETYNGHISTPMDALILLLASLASKTSSTSSITTAISRPISARPEGYDILGIRSGSIFIVDVDCINRWRVCVIIYFFSNSLITIYVGWYKVDTLSHERTVPHVQVRKNLNLFLQKNRFNHT